MYILVVVALHTGIVSNPGCHLRNVNFVGRVTRRACRNDGWILFPEFAFNYLLMGLLDFGMAFHTGPGDPVRSNRGVGTGMRQYQVVVMAVVTGGCYNKASLK